MSLLNNPPPKKVVNGQKTISVSVEEGANPFAPPKNCDAITVNYPSNTIEEYEYRTGGIGGTVINTVTVTYLTSSKKDITTVVIT